VGEGIRTANRHRLTHVEVVTDFALDYGVEVLRLHVSTVF